MENQNYKFLKDWGEIKEGTIVSLDEFKAMNVTPDVIQEGLADGTIELVEATPEDTVPTAPVFVYEGKDVVVDGFRTVEGIEFHHIQTADGAEYDVTDEAYETMVSAAA